MWGYPYHRDPQLRTTEMGIAFVSENHWRFSASGREGSLLKTDVFFLGPVTQVVTAPAWGVYYLVLQPLGCTQQGPAGALFLEKFLVETQTVIELCRFGKGTHLHHLKCTAGAPSPTC